MAAAEKRQHVMLAQAVDLDVLHDDHAVRLLGEDGAVDDLLEVSACAGCEERQCVGDALRRFDETFAIRILAERDQDLADKLANPVRIRMPAHWIPTLAAIAATLCPLPPKGE